MDISQPVSRTAFYCCVIRADDAARPDPICGDSFAARVVDEQIRRDLAPATRLRSPAVSNVARHRMIDDLVREALALDPHLRVILIGAGFDTRAYRLGGGRYVEIDDPSLLAFKEQRLPAAEAANPVERMPVVFQSESADQYLSRLAGDDRALIVLEGVSMYLTDDALRQLAEAVMRHLPNGTLVCDLMSAAFARRFGGSLRKAFASFGATFGNHAAQPSELFVRAGMTPVMHRSIAGYASQLGRLSIPRWVLNTLLRELRDGYQIWVFRWDKAATSRLVEGR